MRPRLATLVALLALPLAPIACSSSAPKPAASPSEPPPAASAAAPPPESAPSTTLAVPETQANPTKLEPLPQTTEAPPAGKRPKGPARHEPGRTPSDIQAQVKPLRDQARACYDAAVKAHPGIEGDLVMNFTIDPTGAVGHLEVDPAKSAIVEPAVVDCIAALLSKSLVFPASPGGFETHGFYPFNFKAHRH